MDETNDSMNQITAMDTGSSPNNNNNMDNDQSAAIGSSSGGVSAIIINNGRDTVTIGTCPQNVQELKNELSHFLKRMSKLQEQIHLSSIASSNVLANPQIWQTNCLNAVKNCVDRWSHIISFYHLNNAHFLNNAHENIENTDNNNNSNRILVDNTDETAQELFQKIIQKEIPKSALQLFNLIQMVMQIGPLEGSNPGYFKRCGSDVARMAFDFLISITNNNANTIVVRDSQDDVHIANGDCNCDSDNSDLDSEDDHHDINSNQYNDCDNNEKIIPTNIDTVNQDDSDDSYLYVVTQLKFTIKQRDIIQKWIINAEKAIQANKGPSKSGLKMQQSSKSKKSQKKLKYKKKQQQQKQN